MFFSGRSSAIRTGLLRSIGHPAGLAAWTLCSMLAGCGGGGTHGLTQTPARFALFEGGDLPPGSAVFQMSIHGQTFGVASINGFGGTSFNGLVVFNPATGKADAPIALPTTLSFSGFNAGAGLEKSDGTPVTSCPANFPGGTALIGRKLFIALNNFDTGTFVYNPGVVLIHEVRNGILQPPRTIVLGETAGATFEALYNPSALKAFTDPVTGDPRLAVVCGDDAFSQFYGRTPAAAVVVIDPLSEDILSVSHLGAAAAGSGDAVLASDGKLYVGSSVKSEIYEVDLSAAPPVVTRGATNPIDVTTEADPNQISSIALSFDENTLYALNSNDGALTALDRTAAFGEVARFEDFRRSIADRDQATGNPFANQPLTLVVRPGRPGVDYQGPGLYVASILLDAADQPATDIRTTIDTVTLDAEGTPIDVGLDVFFHPFSPKTDLQALVQHPELPGRLYAIEGATGIVHVVRPTSLDP